jgi:hypothetical protein
MKAKAARFVRDVLGDPDRAEEFEAMSPEEYATRKRIEIQNLKQRGWKGTAMAKPNRDELEARIDELEEENQILSEKLDSISEIAAVVDDGEEEDDDEDDDLAA